jgi:hypothetical protein
MVPRQIFEGVESVEVVDRQVRNCIGRRKPDVDGDASAPVVVRRLAGAGKSSRSRPRFLGSHRETTCETGCCDSVLSRITRDGIPSAVDDAEHPADERRAWLENQHRAQLRISNASQLD